MSALFKLIQKWPWILLCTWPSTSRQHSERRWCVSCPRWRHQHPPNRESGPSPGCLGDWSTAQATTMSREARLRLGPETEPGGANRRIPGGYQATMNRWLWFISSLVNCLRIYLILKKNNYVFCIQVEILKRSRKKLYIVINICLEFTKSAKLVVNVSVTISSLCLKWGVHGWFIMLNCTSHCLGHQQKNRWVSTP